MSICKVCGVYGCMNMDHPQIARLREVEAYAENLTRAMNALADECKCQIGVSGMWVAGQIDKALQSGHEIGIPQPVERRGLFGEAIWQALDGAQGSHAVGHCYIAANGIDDRCPPGGCVALEECMRESRAKGSHSQGTGFDAGFKAARNAAVRLARQNSVEEVAQYIERLAVEDYGFLQ